MGWDVVVIGAGPAGLLAAARAAERGRRTLLLEKNRRPGVKILMSGGTRCNLTHDTDARGIVEAFGSKGEFLHAPLASLGPRDLVDLVEAEGVPTKVESLGKIFPASDEASDVLEVFLRRLQRSRCRLETQSPVRAIDRDGAGFRVTTSRGVHSAHKIIVTTGGSSYPTCGTTGDGFLWARGLGHTIVSLRPALVPVTVDAPWTTALQGVTIPDVGVRVVELARPGVAGESALHAGAREARGAPAPRRHAHPGALATRRGSFLFAHFGLSGPVVLDVSRAVSTHPDPGRLVLECDFLPDMTEGELDTLLKRAGAVSGRRPVAGVLAEGLPRRLTETLVALSGIPRGEPAAHLSREERSRLVRAVKEVQIPVTGTLGFERAEVTAGGILLGEVDSRDMQSKIVPNLHFAGEILDLDGPIGGYHFQFAFSTGWLAGGSV